MLMAAIANVGVSGRRLISCGSIVQGCDSSWRSDLDATSCERMSRPEKFAPEAGPEVHRGSRQSLSAVFDSRSRDEQPQLPSALQLVQENQREAYIHELNRSLAVSRQDFPCYRSSES